MGGIRIKPFVWGFSQTGGSEHEKEDDRFHLANSVIQTTRIAYA